MTVESDYQGRRVLVTGGAGFIGSHLVDALVSAGASVTVIDDLSTGRAENLAESHGKIEFICSDLRDVPIRDQIGRFQVIFHLIGTAYVPTSVDDPIADFEKNARQTTRFLEKLRFTENPPPVVYVSSAAVYGNPEWLSIREDDPTVPISPYGVSKLAAERYMAVYAWVYGLRTAIVRPFSVYGRRQRKQVVYDLIRKLRDDPDHLQIIGDGTQTRDFIHVSDVARAMMAVGVASPMEGRAYNVATGLECSIATLAGLITRAMAIEPEITYTGSLRSGDANRWKANIGRLLTLGFAPQVELSEGIRDLVDWYDRS